MSALTDFDLDETGKIDLSDIYDRPDPRDYYQTLVNLDYRIPAEAEPIFRAVIAAERGNRQRHRLKVLDVGCSYGVNAAILKHGCALPDLFRRYGVKACSTMSRRDLIARDRADVSTISGDLTFVGLDPAERAVAYAREAGVLDAFVTRDLEHEEPSGEENALLSDTDLVISTGAIGYVGPATFAHILDCTGNSPWLALFALRMFPIDGIAEMLEARGYSVFKLAGRTFRQRHFADRKEQAEVLANLADLGIDPAGREADGWYHAEFFFARPSSEQAPPPMPGLVSLQDDQRRS